MTRIPLMRGTILELVLERLTKRATSRQEWTGMNGSYLVGDVPELTDGSTWDCFSNMAKPRHWIFVGFRLIGLRKILGCHTETLTLCRSEEVYLTGTPKNVSLCWRLLEGAQDYLPLGACLIGHFQPCKHLIIETRICQSEKREIASVYAGVIEYAIL
jgi:hypothetical protein